MRSNSAQAKSGRPKTGNIRLLERRFIKTSKEIWTLLPEDDTEMVAILQRYEDVFKDLEQTFSRIGDSRPYNKREKALLDKVRRFIAEVELVRYNI